jgi:hypothetical protein
MTKIGRDVLGRRVKAEFRKEKKAKGRELTPEEKQMTILKTIKGLSRRDIERMAAEFRRKREWEYY